MNVLPIFRTNYSVGKSILTLDKDKRKPDYPVSVFHIAEENNLKEVVVIDESFSGAIEAYQNAAAKKIKMVFGVCIFATDTLDHEQSDFKKRRSKINIISKNVGGYTDLLKIWTKAARDGNVKGIPHILYKDLNAMMTENLTLTIPFYDSFLHLNNLHNSFITPDFKVKPVFFLEDNELPTDEILRAVVEKYCSENGYSTIETQSIFYENREDFEAYLAFRCIKNRTTVDKPELDGMSSDTFCFEHWKERA